MNERPTPASIRMKPLPRYITGTHPHAQWIQVVDSRSREVVHLVCECDLDAGCVRQYVTESTGTGTFAFVVDFSAGAPRIMTRVICGDFDLRYLGDL